MFFETFLKKINKKGFSKSPLVLLLCRSCCATAVVRRQWCEGICFAIKSFKYFFINQYAN